jgi:hypothetical protein
MPINNFFPRMIAPCLVVLCAFWGLLLTWAIGAVGPGRGASHQVGELAVRYLEQHLHLVVLQFERSGDDVFSNALVPEPDRDCMRNGKFPNCRRSIHVSEGKEGG